MKKIQVSDVEVGAIVMYEGEAGRVTDIDCEAVDTRMGGTYLYTFAVEFGDNTVDEFTRWEGEEIEVASNREVANARDQLGREPEPHEVEFLAEMGLL